MKIAENAQRVLKNRGNMVQLKMRKGIIR